MSHWQKCEAGAATEAALRGVLLRPMLPRTTPDVRLIGWNALATRMVAAALVCVAAATGGGCSSGPERSKLNIVRDRAESASKRTKAVEEIREEQSAAARAGEGAITPKDVYKEIAWTVSEPPRLRAAVIDALLNDKDQAVVNDAREMTKLMLPKEGAREVVVAICRNAGTKGWVDFTPAIVRAYAKTLPGVTEEDRVERRALMDLHPGKPVEEAVFGVFLNPPQIPPTEGIDWTMRYRADAWNVLARIDPQGTARTTLMQTAGASGTDPVLDALRAASSQLRVVPITGDELTWLVSLHSPKNKDNAAWWKSAAAAVSRVPASETLRMRHLEPVRWAAANRPEYLSMPRSQLEQAVQARLSGRQFYQRTVTEGKKVDGPVKSELFDRRVAELSWGDLLALVVIDEAVHQPHIVKALFAQASSDRADTSTEYGGLMAFKQNKGEPERPVVMLYMPRGAQRRGDTQFVASDEMVGASDQSLVHYHFHVQKERNAEYAGPSRGDYEYATRFGRSCLVFTSIREGVMAIDYYQPGDVCIDLGGLVQTP
jgi:hypothetical protein